MVEFDRTDYDNDYSARLIFTATYFSNEEPISDADAPIADTSENNSSNATDITTKKNDLASLDVTATKVKTNIEPSDIDYSRA